MHPDLASLFLHMPGAGGACVWRAAHAHPIPAPELTANNRSRGESRDDIIAVGAAWPIPHVADGLTLHTNGDPELCAVPPPIEIWNGIGWVPYTDGLTIRIADNTIEYAFLPVASTMIRIPLARAASISRLGIHRALAETDPASMPWPERMVDGSLEHMLLDQDEDPSFESLAMYGLSMPSWAMIGIKDSGHEQAVYWDGRIHCHGRRIFLELGEPGLRLAKLRDTIRRNLLDGWLPAVEVTARFGKVAVRQTVLTTFADPDRTKPATFIRVDLTNEGQTAFAGPLRIPIEDAPPDPFDWGLGVEIFTPPADKSASTWAANQTMVRRNGRPFLVFDQPARHDSPPDCPTFDVRLQPGATISFRFAVPSPPWEPSAGEAQSLAGLPWENVMDSFREYWNELMLPATRLILPEPRLMNMQRGVLAQLFINGYGDIMAYGAAPSNYDGSIYGGEEGYAIMALGYNGFTDDAQRYLTGTYLRPEFLSKTAVFEKVTDRNQQNKNGLVPYYAVSLFRLTRDRRWLDHHLDMLRECAEWTLRQIQHTRAEGDGSNPLVRGLLPQWAHGGDITEPCHSLCANWFCWRGLNDTAWLMEAVGDSATAQRYQREADTYRETILSVMDAIYRKDADPPFMPISVEGIESCNGDFYQLITDFFMLLMPLPDADPRSRYFPDYIRQDNRKFCMLSRFRSDGYSEGRNFGSGGLDAIYSSGYILQHLRNGRVKEFLLGFYGFQVFNMEHNCFTSRECNRIYAADPHLEMYHHLSDWSDPLPCSSAVALLLLRHLLVTEETTATGGYTDALLLLHGAPRRWFNAGEQIAMDNAATHAGRLSFKVVSAPDARRITAEISLPSPNRCSRIDIRLRHPGKRRMKAVSINEEPSDSFCPDDERVDVHNPLPLTRITAFF